MYSVETLPSGVVATVRADRSRLEIAVTISFMEPIKGSYCIWLNPGLKLERIDAQTPIEYSASVTKDPDLGIYGINRVRITLKHSVYGLRMVYSGVLKPIIYDLWGTHGEAHIARAETLWYPLTLSCDSVFWGLVLAEHKIAVLRFAVEEGLVPTSSLEYQGVEDGMHVFTSTDWKTGYLEFIVAPFRKNEICREKSVYVYSIGDPVHSPRRILDILLEVENAIGGIFGVRPPYKQYNIVFLEKGGGFKAGSLIALAKDLVREERGLKANVVHEILHTWWGEFIKPGSPDSLWLTEAIPEYMTTVVLDAMGVIKMKDVVKKTMKQAKEVVKSRAYKPPSSISIPLSEDEERSWRIVGEAIFYEIAKDIGYDTLNRILGSHMKKALESRDRYVLSWSSLLEEITSKSKKVAKKLEKYFKHKGN